MPDRYDPSSFEAKWRARWKDANLFLTREESGRKKFYALDFFPYPSGAGLSVGHCRNYIPTDVIARMKYMQGYNVLHPMGFDAFGLPAENEAIKTKSHPQKMIQKYAANYHRQMDLIGIGYDWSRSFSSSDPSFYKWTQWIFELLYNRGLAYQKMASVNWDPVEQTVLADEEVIGGLGWRSGVPVEKKLIPQWFFKITAYADRLAADLDTIDWPEGIKAQQRNWIGRSEGVEFRMKVDMASLQLGQTFFEEKGSDDLAFRVFTTRIDTIFGMTFCVLAPEHALIDQLLNMVGEEHANQIRAYKEKAKSLSDVDRQAANLEKTGVFTGAYAINPGNGEKVQIWIADYVLSTYGTGAIMAVPGHDSRDYEFAKKFGIEVKEVIAPIPPKGQDTKAQGAKALPYEAKDGIMINSGEYTGSTVYEGQLALGKWFEGLGIGERKTQYRLRDWLISRQRYWGCPIPVIYDADGEKELVTEDCLPVTLPEVDNYEPSGDGSSPLKRIPEFVNVTDSEGKLGHRETDTMGGFACSSWYFLRFCDPENYEEAWSQEKAAYWMPVDCYVGGAEHAVMHLLYARFWTKVLFDAGLVSVSEPFARLQNQGQVLAQTPYRKPREGEKLAVGEDGIQLSFSEAKALPKDQVFYRWARMSKSKGNVVTPDEVVESQGADALRLYELFVAPFTQDVQWQTDDIKGQVRFLHRIFKLTEVIKPYFKKDWAASIRAAMPTAKSAEIRRATHTAIAKATEDIDRFAFNTYVSALMIFSNALQDAFDSSAKPPAEAESLALSEAIESLILLLAPGAPHSADELWETLGKKGFTYHQEWPIHDPSLLVADTVTIAVQVNGKLRDTVSVASGASNEDHELSAKASPKVQSNLEDLTIRKIIVIPGKLVNIVAN
ncbi:MAG TPA: leucine--tRNA ligase [Fimbriimonadaceae bacterium]|jgi:leucyl-tRNA synthetase